MQTDRKNAEVINDGILFGMSVRHNPRAAGIESDLKTLVLITWAQTLVLIKYFRAVLGNVFVQTREVICNSTEIQM